MKTYNLKLYIKRVIVLTKNEAENCAYNKNALILSRHDVDEKKWKTRLTRHYT